MQKACNSLSCTLLLIVYYVFTFRHYFTSSKVNDAELQRLTSACSKYDNIMIYSYLCLSIVIYEDMI